MTCRERILSEEYIALVTDFRLPPEILEMTEGGVDYCYHPLNGEYGIFYLDQRMLPRLSLSDYMYRYIPQIFGLLQQEEQNGREEQGREGAETRGETFDSQPLAEAGILEVQDAPLQLTGRGVVLAFIDTGLNYQNPVFRYPDGSSRILAVWDQTDQSGEPPSGFLYGSEYTREQIDLALQEERPETVVPFRDEIGHGTAMASVAAGSRIGGGIAFRGAAPDAEIVAVKLKPAKQSLRDYYLVKEGVPAYSSTDILQAIQYVSQFAIPFQRPVVLCLGIGTGLGHHNGDSILSLFLQDMSRKINRMAVIGGGNEGNSGHHYRGSGSADVEIRVAEGTKGFLVEFWAMVPDIFSMSVRSPGGEVVPAGDFRVNRHISHTFLYEKTKITIDYVLVEQNTGDELIVLRMEDPSPGVWTLGIVEERGQGRGVYDLWMSMEQLMQGEAYFLRPSPEVTMTPPAYVEDALSVTAYDSRRDSFYAASGQGFSRKGELKPDVASPGVDITAVSGMLGGAPVLASYTGSSMASAIAAGAGAQMMQWAVVEGHSLYASSLDICRLLIRGAGQKATESYPNRRWGFGQLDVAGTFEEIAGIRHRR